jgi:hypothetical protein
VRTNLLWILQITMKDQKESFMNHDMGEEEPPIVQIRTYCEDEPQYQRHRICREYDLRNDSGHGAMNNDRVTEEEMCRALYLSIMTTSGLQNSLQFFFHPLCSFSDLVSRLESAMERGSSSGMRYE